VKRGNEVLLVAVKPKRLSFKGITVGLGRVLHRGRRGRRGLCGGEDAFGLFFVPLGRPI